MIVLNDQFIDNRDFAYLLFFDKSTGESEYYKFVAGENLSRFKYIMQTDNHIFLEIALNSTIMINGELKQNVSNNTLLRINK